MQLINLGKRDKHRFLHYSWISEDCFIDCYLPESIKGCFIPSAHTFFSPPFSFWRESGIFVFILSFAFLRSGKVIYVGQIWSQWLICVKPVALSWFRAVQDPALLQQLNVGGRRSLIYFEWLITFRAHLMNLIVPDLKSKPGYIN